MATLSELRAGVVEAAHRTAVVSVAVLVGLGWVCTVFSSTNWAWNAGILTALGLAVLFVAPEIEIRVGERSVRLGPDRPRLHLEPFAAGPVKVGKEDAGDRHAWRRKVNNVAVEAAWEEVSQMIIQEWVYDAFWSHMSPDKSLPREARDALNHCFGVFAERARRVDINVCLAKAVHMLTKTIDTYRSVRAGIGESGLAHVVSAAKRDGAVRSEMKATGLLHPALHSPDGLYHFLTVVSSQIVQHTLPERYASCGIVDTLVRELFTACVLKQAMHYGLPHHLGALILSLAEPAAPVHSPLEADGPPQRALGAAAVLRAEALALKRARVYDKAEDAAADGVTRLSSEEECMLQSVDLADQPGSNDTPSAAGQPPSKSRPLRTNEPPPVAAPGSPSPPLHNSKSMPPSRGPLPPRPAQRVESAASFSGRGGQIELSLYADGSGAGGRAGGAAQAVGEAVDQDDGGGGEAGDAATCFENGAFEPRGDGSRSPSSTLLGSQQVDDAQSPSSMGLRHSDVQPAAALCSGTIKDEDAALALAGPVRQQASISSDGAVSYAKAFRGMPHVRIPTHRTQASAVLFAPSFTLYEIHVCEQQEDGSLIGLQWAVRRRYSEFETLHKRLLAAFPAIESLPPVFERGSGAKKTSAFGLPGKRATRLTEDQLTRRREQLEAYLQALVRLTAIAHSRHIFEFLDPESDVYGADAAAAPTTSISALAQTAGRRLTSAFKSSAAGRKSLPTPPSSDAAASPYAASSEAGLDDVPIYSLDEATIPTLVVGPSSPAAWGADPPAAAATADDAAATAAAAEDDAEGDSATASAPNLRPSEHIARPPADHDDAVASSPAADAASSASAEAAWHASILRRSLSESEVDRLAGHDATHDAPPSDTTAAKRIDASDGCTPQEDRADGSAGSGVEPRETRDGAAVSEDAVGGAGDAVDLDCDAQPPRPSKLAGRHSASASNVLGAADGAAADEAAGEPERLLWLAYATELFDCIFDLGSQGMLRKQMRMFSMNVVSFLVRDALDRKMSSLLHSALRSHVTFSRALLSLKAALWPGGVWYSKHAPPGEAPPPGVKPPEMTPTAFMAAPVDAAAAARVRDRLSALLNTKVRETLGSAARLVVLSEASLREGCQLMDEMLQCETITLHVALQALGIVVGALFPEVEPIFALVR